MAIRVSTWDETTLKVSISPLPVPDFVLLVATDYRHGQPCTLTVLGLDGTYTVRWSPSASDPSAAGSVALTVVSDDLDIDGAGTVIVTGQRGIVRYGSTGYLWLVMGEDTASLAKTLLAHGGRQTVVLSGVIQPWVTSQAVTTGDQRWVQSAGEIGRLYEATTTGTTGATAPTHSTGTVSDGTVSWLYLRDYMRLDALPDLDDGDLVAWWNALPSGEVEVFQDATYEASGQVTSFEAEAHVAGEGYGVSAVQQIVGLLTISAGQLVNRTTEGFEIRFSTDTGSGTAYYVVFPRTSSDPDDPAQIVAGDDGDDEPALRSGSMAVTETGVQTFPAVTGLDPAIYRVAVVQLA
jgi:hypothetical protein